MITHALLILQNELDEHLKVYDQGSEPDRVVIANMAEGVKSGNANGTVDSEKLVFTIVNIREEKALKNLPNYVRNDVTMKASYENPPVFLNFLLLLSATHGLYTNATLYISRAIRFFQYKNVFTQDTVSPDSLNIQKHSMTTMDQLESFKLILDLYSPSLEEVNHLWGTLGGKQYPFVLYMLRMIDLKFKGPGKETGLITEVVSEFYHKKSDNGHG
ncbi:MAG: DUF4255 domain-containing protein [Saprospiraceae bacterium]|nr:DUF4255 domain-containing protein [Saprospiraceae bacterium]